MADPRFIPVADQALLVEFGQEISDEANRAVAQLDRALSLHPPKGVSEVAPAFVNLLVVFDPLKTDHGEVAEAARALLDVAVDDAAEATPREVVACYEDDLAPDLDSVASQTGLSREAVINAHLAGEYHVVMYGFAPGYAYMAGVPPALRLPRKTAALRDVPAGSLLIAGAQCLVSTITMPTGWWIIGRAATQILRDDPDRPFLFDVGDPVTFRRVDRAGFEALNKGGAHG